MDVIKSKIKKWISVLCHFMDTPYFALILAAIQLINSYTGLDLFVIAIISLCFSFAILFKKNLNCLLVIFFFTQSVISLKNSPANLDPNSNSTFYLQPSVYITCVVFASIPILLITYKAIKNILTKKINFDVFFVSTLLLGLSFLLNGLLVKEQNLLNAMFGSFMFFFFVILYFAVIPYVELSKKSFTTISKQIVIYLIVPIVQMTVFYISFFASGNKIVSRTDVFVGWGERNALGMKLAISFPFLLYLTKVEENKRLKKVFYLMNFFFLCFVVLTFSRQTYLAVLMLLVFYFVSALYRSKGNQAYLQKKLILFASFSFLGLAILKYLNVPTIIKNDLHSFGRIELWKLSIESFIKFPIFGGGFFFLGGDNLIKLDSIMPLCSHNTFFEILGACGIFGLISYIFYRILSFRIIFKWFSLEKKYVFMSLCLILFVSLLDIHLFGIFGTSFYAMFLAFSTCKKDSLKSVELEAKTLFSI